MKDPSSFIWPCFINPQRTRERTSGLFLHHTTSLFFSQTSAMLWRCCLHLQEGERVPGYITQGLSHCHKTSIQQTSTVQALVSFPWVMFAELWHSDPCERMLALWVSWWVCSSSNCCDYAELLRHSLPLFVIWSSAALQTRPGLYTSVMCMHICARIFLVWFVCVWLWLVYFASALNSICCCHVLFYFRLVQILPVYGDVVSGFAHNVPGHETSQVV